MKKIESRQNPVIKNVIRLLKDRKFREQLGYFVCEGRKMLREACQCKQCIREIFVCNPDEAEQLDREIGENTEVYLLPENLLRQISAVQTPQNLLFTCQISPCFLEQIPEPHKILVLDALQDPGNLGTILRCADAFAFDGVVLLPGCADLYNPKTVRSTMGAVFRVPTIRADGRDFFAYASDNGLPVYAAALTQNSEPITKFDLSRCAIIIGNEGNGVSKGILEKCDKKLIIPMPGRAESLNASIAAAIMMWEMTK